MAISSVFPSAGVDTSYLRIATSDMKDVLYEMADALFAQPTKMQAIYNEHTAKMEELLTKVFHKGIACVFSKLYNGDNNAFESDFTKLLLTGKEGDKMTHVQRAEVLRELFDVLEECFHGNYKNLSSFFKNEVKY